MNSLFRPITTFEKNDGMLACELSHRVTHPASLVLARLIISELGNASFENLKTYSSWYAYAHFEGAKVPFSVTIDHNGQASIACSVLEEDALALALRNIVPDLEICEIGAPRKTMVA